MMHSSIIPMDDFTYLQRHLHDSDQGQPYLVSETDVPHWEVNPLVPQANIYQGYNFQLQNFPKIPLISSNGCINYNHVIAMRQLGYPIWENHKDDDVNEFILNSGGTTHQELLRRIICAWEKVHTKENELKRKNITTRESYTQ